MEVRNLWILPLSVYTDEALKISYIKVLTEIKFETIKLPTYLSQYRYQHLLQPTNILFIELVKTKKNWILKNILQTQNVVDIKQYTDYLKFAEINNIILSYFQDESESNLFSEILTVFKKNNLHFLDLKKFQTQLETCLGFK